MSAVSAWGNASGCRSNRGVLRVLVGDAVRTAIEPDAFVERAARERNAGSSP